MPMPPPMALAGPLNPIETLVNSFNTNPYFIGLAMTLLNLGGRHLAGGLTPDQDKIFQHPWIRRGLLFVVVFVATRNLFTALWLSIALILVIGFLTNETSDLYLFGEPKAAPAASLTAASLTAAPAPQGLTGEEQEILRRLQEKAAKAQEPNVLSTEAALNQPPAFWQAYQKLMQEA
jgi:hypothetical protein